MGGGLHLADKLSSSILNSVWGVYLRGWVVWGGRVVRTWREEDIYLRNRTFVRPHRRVERACEPRNRIAQTQNSKGKIPILYPVARDSRLLKAVKDELARRPMHRSVA
jgi:hypothetical protein